MKQKKLPVYIIGFYIIGHVSDNFFYNKLLELFKTGEWPGSDKTDPTPPDDTYWLIRYRCLYFTYGSRRFQESSYSPLRVLTTDIESFGCKSSLILNPKTGRGSETEQKPF